MFTTFHSKHPCEHSENANVYQTLTMKCPKCFWHDYYKICPICDHQIPEGRNYFKEGFLMCHYCGAVTHKNVKTLETNFYSPFNEENSLRSKRFRLVSETEQRDFWPHEK